jgi:hypothetical protein
MDDFLIFEHGGIQGGMTVRCRMSENVRACLEAVFTGCLDWLAGAPGQAVFPDAYFDRADSAAFRERHGPTMRSRASAAVRRVLYDLGEGTEFALDGAGTGAWFTAAAHAQSAVLSTPRWSAGRLEPLGEDGESAFAWLRLLQHDLAHSALGDERCRCGAG